MTRDDTVRFCQLIVDIKKQSKIVKKLNDNYLEDTTGIMKNELSKATQRLEDLCYSFNTEFEVKSLVP